MQEAPSPTPLADSLARASWGICTCPTESLAGGGCLSSRDASPSPCRCLSREHLTQLFILLTWINGIEFCFRTTQLQPAGSKTKKRPMRNGASSTTPARQTTPAPRPSRKPSTPSSPTGASTFLFFCSTPRSSRRRSSTSSRRSCRRWNTATSRLSSSRPPSGSRPSSSRLLLLGRPERRTIAVSISSA